MLNKTTSAFAVLTAFSLFLSVAHAGPPTNTHEVTETHVMWTLSPARDCAAAPNGLAGSGMRHRVRNMRVNPDGSKVITRNDVVRGIAWDLGSSEDQQYHFIYQNHLVERVPVGGGPHEVSMEDNFILNGNGEVGHLAAGFHWTWTYTPPDTLWPPSENWQQISTHGDPLRCDPL